MNLTPLLNKARKELEIAKVNATRDGKTAQAALQTAVAAKQKFKQARKLVKFTRKAARKAENQADAALEALEKAQARLEKLEKRARKKARKQKTSAKKKGARRAGVEKETGGTQARPPGKTESRTRKSHSAGSRTEAGKAAATKKICQATGDGYGNGEGRTGIAGRAGGTGRYQLAGGCSRAGRGHTPGFSLK